MNRGRGAVLAAGLVAALAVAGLIAAQGEPDTGAAAAAADPRHPNPYAHDLHAPQRELPSL
jgi:hypothetical protein